MNDSATSPDQSSGFPRWLKWSLLGALAVLVVGYGAIFLYAKVINDSPDEFDQSDLDAALVTDDDPGASVGGDADTSTTTATQAPAAAPSADGVAWRVTDESQVGYRVKEVLFGVDSEAVGRTNQITGEFAISGTQVVSGEFVVDVGSIESDDGRRDNQFTGRIMSADEFPEAVFTLTEPIDIGSESAEGVEVSTTATGELTLRGVTNPVTFDVTAQQSNGRIGVLGSIPVVFADFSIANPSFGGITTEDNGVVEFVLVFEPA